VPLDHTFRDGFGHTPEEMVNTFDDGACNVASQVSRLKQLKRGLRDFPLHQAFRLPGPHQSSTTQDESNRNCAS
jgi:hypothetical protein